MAKAPVNKTVADKPLLSTVKFNGKVLWVIMALMVLVGGYVVTRLYAASGTMMLVPSATTVNLGATVTVAIRVNSGTDTVNTAQANLAFDSTKLQYVSVSETGSNFPLAFQTVVGTGTLQITRATVGGTPAVSGDNLVTTVTFKALAAGSVPITLASGSALYRSTDNVDILAVKTGTTLTLADTAAPTVPTGLASSNVAMSGLTLTWAVSTDNVGVTGYRVYRNGTQIATPASSSFTDTGLTPGTAYQYKVAAADAAGNLSAQSVALSVTTLPDTSAPTVPGTPTSATQTMTSISLSWPTSTDNAGVVGYRVYRNAAQIATSASNTYTDTGLAVNTSYSYTVAAYDAAGNVSAQSAAVVVKTLTDTVAPSTPAGLGGSSSGTSVTLAWTAATDNVAVTLYIVYLDGVQQGTTTATVYTATGVTAGSHSFTVAARDGAGNTSAQSTAVVVSIYQAADINHDGKVNGIDLSTLLTNWNLTGASSSDVNGDGIVNAADLSVILTKWTG